MKDQFFWEIYLVVIAVSIVLLNLLAKWFGWDNERYRREKHEFAWQRFIVGI